MSQRNGKNKPPEAKAAASAQIEVARPTMSCFATSVAVAKATHESVGKLCRMQVEAGDLQIVVLFPLKFAHQIGSELQALTGVVVAQPSEMPKGPPA